MSAVASRAALISVVSNSVLTGAKLVTGALTGSIGIMSEAAHSGIDLLAAVMAWLAIRLAAKPADDRHEFGHGKIENLSGTIEALLIFFIAVLIIREAVGKLWAGREVAELGVGIVVMAVSAAVNFVVSEYLFRVGRQADSIALKADAAHLRTDVWTSAGVFAGLVGIWTTGWHILDPIMGMVVAGLLIKVGYDLTVEAFLPLLDVRLPSAEKNAIAEIVSEHGGEFIEFHQMRTRKAGGERHIDLHLVVPKDRLVGEVHELCHHIADDIAAKFPRTQVLIHVEPCDEDSCENCRRCKEYR